MNSKNKTKKVLEERDGVKYIFNHEMFSNIFRIKFNIERQKHKISVENFRVDFADSIGYSASEVKNWKAGKHSPKLDTVKEIAEIWGIDYRELLLEKREKDDMDSTVARTPKYDTAKKLYLLFAKYIEMYGEKNFFAECQEELVEIEEPVYEVGTSVEIVDDSSGSHIMIKRLKLIEEERALHSELRRSIRASRFELDEGVVDELINLLYEIEPDPIANHTGFLPDGYEKYIGMGEPYANYYLAEEVVTRLYQRLNLIFEAYFA